MQKNVLEYLEKTAELFPDKIGYSDDNSTLTFKEIINYSKQAASFILHKLNFQHNKPIAVLLPKNIQALTIFHGITYSGNIYVPIDIAQPVERIKNIFNTLNPALVIVNEQTSKLVDFINNKDIIIKYTDILDYTIDYNSINKIRQLQISTDPLYILFTSGSTGNPKGVVINHQAVIDYIDWITDTFTFLPEDILGSQAPFYFDNSVLDIYTTLKIGCHLHIINELLFGFVENLLSELKNKNITTIFWVPSALIKVAASGLLKEHKTLPLNKVLFCGEIMPNKALNEWRYNYPDILYANLYGPTEITDVCSYYIADREFKNEEPLPIGKACNNTEILILNDDNKLVQNQEIGEICVRGISLAMGYYRNPEKTSEVFVQNPLNDSYTELIYRTGDLGYYNKYDEIICIGRKDFQIKHNGYRIELGEIETAVASIKEINNLCVLYNQTAKEITMFYSAENELEVKNIRKNLLQLIPLYAIPTKIIYIKEMPLTPNGKIDRQSLKKQYLGY